MKRTIDLQESNKRLAEINEELKQCDHLQKEFINVAVHEMRTPIQPILGMAGMIKEKIANLDRQHQLDMTDDRNRYLRFTTHSNLEPVVSLPTAQIVNMLDAIYRNAKRLDKLSDNLLDLSRIENKSLKLNKEKIDLNGKIRSAIINANSSINTSNKGVEIIFQPSTN